MTEIKNAKEIYDTTQIPSTELATKIRKRGKWQDEKDASVRADGNQGNKTSAAIGGTFAR